jgi:hypothetical protein
MKRKKIFGFERNVFYTGVTSFFTDTSTKMIYSVMPLFLLSIGASKTAISLIEGIAESTASLLKAFSGYWSDKIGKNKPFMIIGYGITAIITPLYAVVRFPVQVLVLRFLERIGKGLRTAPRDSLISSSAKKNDAGKNFGFHKMMDNSGAIIGPLTACAILYFFPLDYPRIFLLATIPAMLGVVTIIGFIKEAHTAEKSQIKAGSYKRLPKKFYMFLVIVIIFSLGQDFGNRSKGIFHSTHIYDIQRRFGIFSSSHRETLRQDRSREIDFRRFLSLLVSLFSVREIQ